MYPEVFGLTWLHTYGVLVAAAFLTALWLAGKLGKSVGLNPDDVTNLGIYCALAAIVVAVSQLALSDAPRIAEAEINPVIVRAKGQGAVAVDGLVVMAS